MAVKGAGNIAITWNSNSLDAYVSSVEFSSSVAELDTTDFDSTAMEYIAGLADFTVSIEFNNWDTTLDGYIGADGLAGTLRTLVLAYTDSGSSTSTYTMANSFISGFTLGGEASGLIGMTGVSIRCASAVRS